MIHYDSYYDSYYSMTYRNPYKDEVKESSGMKIQVYPVKAVMDQEDSVQPVEVRHFEHSRSFKNGKDENEISVLWVERRIFTITDSFPSISVSNRIINIKSTNLKPVGKMTHYNDSLYDSYVQIEVASDGIKEKNRKLREMIQSHMKNDKDISQLGMILQGMTHL